VAFAPHSMAFIWLTMDASMPPYFARHLQNDALLIPCSRQSSATGTPPSAWRKIARIRGSLYLVIFIQNLLIHIAEKILLPQPLTFGGDYRGSLPERTASGFASPHTLNPVKRAKPHHRGCQHHKTNNHRNARPDGSLNHKKVTHKRQGN
jgi:hypothetical protein